MFRSEPFNIFDGVGWGTVNLLPSGHADKTYMLWDRNPVAVAYKQLAAGKIGGEPAKDFSGPHY